LLDQHYIGSVPSQSEQKGTKGYSTMMEVYLQNLWGHLKIKPPPLSDLSQLLCTEH
ncbi:hypothetical protein ACLKA7_007650, partial [Drosophila subpalustris]